MYLLAQTLGAFAAAGVVYANYYSLIHAYDPGLTVAPSPTATAGIFATYPLDGVSKVNQFFDQFIASALLVFVIFALKDDSNKGNFVASGAWFPLALFFLMVCSLPSSCECSKTNIACSSVLATALVSRLALPSTLLVILALAP